MLSHPSSACSQLLPNLSTRHTRWRINNILQSLWCTPVPRRDSLRPLSPSGHCPGHAHGSRRHPTVVRHVIPRRHPVNANLNPLPSMEQQNHRSLQTRMMSLRADISGINDPWTHIQKQREPTKLSATYPACQVAARPENAPPPPKSAVSVPEGEVGKGERIFPPLPSPAPAPKPYANTSPSPQPVPQIPSLSSITCQSSPPHEYRAEKAL